MNTEAPSEGKGRGIVRNPYVWAFIVGVVVLTVMRPLLRFEPDPPPVIGLLPDFSLIDQAGEPYGSAQLAGQVYIVNFFFTACPSTCPRLMQSMAGLQERYREGGIEGIRLVSITVDPANDTPERLGEYAARIEADPRRWVLLTGDPGAVRGLVLQGFKAPMGSPSEVAGGLYDIAHTGKLVLVDGDGGIRGYYDSDELGIDEVFHRSQHVLKSMRRRRR